MGDRERSREALQCEGLPSALSASASINHMMYKWMKDNPEHMSTYRSRGKQINVHHIVGGMKPIAFV